MKKTICKLLITITLSCISINSNAVMVRGMGDCGEWVSKKSVGDEKWLLGFMSGLAIGLNIDLIKNSSSPSLILWMDNFCKANPLVHVGDAAMNLFFELKQKEGLK